MSHGYHSHCCWQLLYGSYDPIYYFLAILDSTFLPLYLPTDLTEGVVKKSINEEFRDVTVILVAHRLDTVKDVDVIVMLDGGEGC